ncbi:hypothetical protein [uncultured Mitsuokella sp.]|uniref:hypothetical protein n=1 Tax=uncultured Mitsuokella sp. TaxID=453120 RepID=UPI0026138054|nr:hypothetical protein [uncultured Mitsuokella sp.]
MAKGEKADFSLTIGLNLDDLFRGMDEANTTISQAISRINSENKQVKLKADISELKAGDDELKKQAIEMQSLTRQIELQTAKLRLLGQARDSAYKRTGDNSSLSRAADTRYLQQEKYVEQLNSELKKMQAAQAAAAAASSGLFGKISTGASAAKKGVSEVTGAYGMLSTKMAGLMAVGMTGAGLFNITQGAMDAGENLYKLSTRLHLTTSEASQLNKLFSISGTSIQAVVPFFSQLDKSVLSSSKGLNSTTMALMKFGVNLKDSAGNLLPINEQLDQLAKGYQKAAEAGKEEEFQAQVLGRRGAELIPLLENYNENMQVASSIKATGLLDPKEAHELSLEWRKMKGEAGQLQMAFGAALMPIAKELMPEVTDVMIKCIDYIKDNKDDIKDSIETAGTALKDVLSILKDIASIMPDATAATKLGEIKGKDNGLDRVKYTAQNGGLLAKVPGIGVSLAEAFDSNGVNEKYYQQLQQQKQAQEDAAKAKKENADAIDDLIQKSEALTQADKTESEAEGVVTDQDNDAVKAANANAQAQYKAAQAMEWRATVAGQLSEKIYLLTHNDIENAQHAMWVEVEKATANGVPQDLIDQFVNARSARIAEDKFRNVTAPMAEAFKTDLQNQLDQVDLQAKAYVRAGATQDEADAWAEQRKSRINADWDRQVASQIDSIWKSSFQNRLDEIDREKEAWKQKGLDEVKATQWAEEKKRQEMETTAQSMFTSDKKYYDVWKKAGGINSGAAGVQAIIKQMRLDKGIPENAFTTPGEVDAFEQAMDQARKNLVPVISDGTYQGVKKAMVEVIRGKDTSYEVPLLNQQPMGAYSGAYDGQSFAHGVGMAVSGVQSAAGNLVEVVRGCSSSWEMAVSNAGQDFTGQINQAAEAMTQDMTQDDSASSQVMNGIVDDVSSAMQEVGSTVKQMPQNLAQYIDDTIISQAKQQDYVTRPVARGGDKQPLQITINNNLSDTVVSNDLTDYLTDQTAGKVADAIKPYVDDSSISNTY